MRSCSSATQGLEVDRVGAMLLSGPGRVPPMGWGGFRNPPHTMTACAVQEFAHTSVHYRMILISPDPWATRWVLGPALPWKSGARAPSQKFLL